MTENLDEGGRLGTSTLPPATTTNCYLVGSRELVIIDPGLFESAIPAPFGGGVDSGIAIIALPV